jgi:hypothetical protein
MVDALHLAFVIHSIYYYLVVSYANLVVLTEVVWSGKVRSTLAVSSINDIEELVQLQIAFNVSCIS